MPPLERKRSSSPKRPFRTRWPSIRRLGLLAGIALLARCGGQAADRCGEGQTLCGSDCADLFSSSAHCGACGHACAEGAECLSGSCASSNAQSGNDAGGACPEGLVRCGEDCVATQSSREHCGRCGTACADGATCREGRCQGGASCSGGRIPCGDGCIDVSQDPTHCGSCDSPCGSGEICQDGACRPGGDCRQTPCVGLSYCDLNSGQCKPGCVSDAQCAANEACDLARHVCACADGFHACGGACVSSSSPDNCGASCAPCPAPANGTATCDGSACGVACQSGWHACGDRCVDNSSAQTCGSNCMPCPTTQDGRATCDGARCGVTCDPGFTDSNGRCVGCADNDDCGPADYCDRITNTCEHGCRDNASCGQTGTWCDWAAGHLCAECADYDFELREAQGSNQFVADGETTSWSFSICGEEDEDYLDLVIRLGPEGVYTIIATNEAAQYSHLWASVHPELSGVGPFALINGEGWQTLSSRSTAPYGEIAVGLRISSAMRVTKPIPFSVSVKTW